MDLTTRRNHSQTRTMLLLFAAAAALLGTAPPARAQSADTIAIDSSVTIFQPPETNGAVQLAVADLQEDFVKVFGNAPRIVSSLADAGPVTIVVGESGLLPESLRPAGATAPESFAISAAQTPTGRALVLTGPDKRGAIYAIYQFSQDYLGVDPMYYWTDREPARHDRIEVPAGLAKTFPAPLFHYRGFFINDEDLLTGWAPGLDDGASISLDVMDKIYETILRLKGNLVVPGTWIFPDDPQVKLVGKRGLIVTTHHAMALGMNVARWPADTPYNYSTHPEILENAWRNAVNLYDPNQEVLWSVGLRGLSDTSYATLDPSVAGNNQRFGMIVSKAIATQMRIARERYPEAKFVTSFWREGAALAREGVLQIPKEVGRVWGDRGFGHIQDGGDVAAGDGIYYHVAMMNGHANQLTEMVPVERIYSELGRFIKAGATNYMLINTSDLRPVTMTTKAIMDAVWGGLPEGSPAKASAQYYRDWAGEQFGEKAAGEVGAVMKEYFAAIPKIPAGHPRAGDEYGDQGYHWIVQDMLRDTMIDPPYFHLPDQDPKWTPANTLGLNRQGKMIPLRRESVEMERDVTAAAQPAWDAVWAHANAARQTVAEDRLPYYEAYVLSTIAIEQESNRMLHLVAQGILDYRDGHPDAARTSMKQSLESLDKIEEIQRESEYGKWKNWYRGEWLTGMRHSRHMIESFLRYLDDPWTSLPIPVQANSWQAYYHILLYQRDRYVDVAAR